MLTRASSVATLIQCRFARQARWRSYIRSEGIDIAILATPGDVAQDVIDRLVACGIRGILNYAPITPPRAARYHRADDRPGSSPPDHDVLPTGLKRRGRRPPQTQTRQARQTRAGRAAAPKTQCKGQLVSRPYRCCSRRTPSARRLFNSLSVVRNARRGVCARRGQVPWG